MAVNQSLTILQVNQNISENKSAVRILWQSTQTGASYNDYSRTATWWLRVNEGQWSTYTLSYTLPKNQTVTLVDVTMEIPHREDGTCLVEAKTEMDTQISAGVVHLTQQLVPDAIARHSTITATDAAIGSSCTITVKKQSSAYRHCIRYSLTGSAPWTYLDEWGKESGQEVIFSADSLSFVVPDHFYEKIPAAKSGVCTLECWTYINENQYLSEPKTATFTYTADPALCGPTVSGSIVDTNEKTLAMTGSESTLVRYMSNACVTITANAHCGAVIRDPNRDISLWHWDGWHYGEEQNFPGVESDFFKLWAQDSRGYTVYRDCYAQEYIPYIRLTNQSRTQRTAPTESSVALTVTGSCYNGNFGGVNCVQNIVRVWYRIATTQAGLQSAPWYEFSATLDGNTYIATIQLDNIPYDEVRWVETWSQDKLDYVTKIVKIGRGVPVFEWGERDFCFHVPVEVPSLKVNGQELDAYIKSVIQGGNI